VLLKPSVQIPHTSSSGLSSTCLPGMGAESLPLESCNSPPSGLPPPCLPFGTSWHELALAFTQTPPSEVFGEETSLPCEFDDSASMVATRVLPSIAAPLYPTVPAGNTAGDESPSGEASRTKPPPAAPLRPEKCDMMSMGQHGEASFLFIRFGMKFPAGFQSLVQSTESKVLRYQTPCARTHQKPVRIRRAFVHRGT
jgi:hypothetical protein